MTDETLIKALLEIWDDLELLTKMDILAKMRTRHPKVYEALLPNL